VELGNLSLELHNLATSSASDVLMCISRSLKDGGSPGGLATLAVVCLERFQRARSAERRSKRTRATWKVIVEKMSNAPRRRVLTKRNLDPRSHPLRGVCRPRSSPMGRFDHQRVINEASRYGWSYVDYQWSQGELVILEKSDGNDRMKLNVWCTTGTVGSFLKHPRQGKTQLFRRECHTWDDLYAVFANPRTHGLGGYHERRELDAREQTPVKRARTEACEQTASKVARTVPCLACGRMYRCMAGMANHFESGSCPHCPGADNARRQAYAFVRQQAPGYTNAPPMLLTFNGAGEQDLTQGYVNGGQNYRCPTCQKSFSALHSMLSHIQARAQCKSVNGVRLLALK